MAFGKLPLKRYVFPAVPFALVFFFFWAIGVQVYPACYWSQAPTIFLDMLVVNYTVPFNDYKEHRGLFWLLNHLKVQPPNEQGVWRLSADYLGYDPEDRSHPRRLGALQELRADLVYLADTYGVYRDDLLGVRTRRAHMDYNPLLFGGLSEDDVLALQRHARGGGHLIAEFNSFCEPTAEKPRQLMEALMGIKWTGWVGRIFEDPYDRDNVPWWFERELKKQFPGLVLPRQPVLVFVHRSGTLVTISRTDLAELVPLIRFSAAGQRRFPDAAGEAPSFFWFGVMQVGPQTTVYAELVFPEPLIDEAAWSEASIPRRIPLLTGYVEGTSQRLYWAADIADIDFDPGPYDRSDIITTRADSIVTRRAITSAPVFFRVYAPVMRDILRELAKQKSAATAAHHGS